MPVINGLPNHKLSISMTACISQKWWSSKHLSAHQNYGSHVPSLFTTARLKAILSSMPHTHTHRCMHMHEHTQTKANTIISYQDLATGTIIWHGHPAFIVQYNEASKRCNRSNICTKHTETDHFQAPKPVTIYLEALSSVSTVRTGLNNLGYIQLHTCLQELWERVQNFIGSLFSWTNYTFPGPIHTLPKEWWSNNFYIPNQLLFYWINRIYKESVANVAGEPDNKQCSSTSK
jgi:hypothetical protein